MNTEADIGPIFVVGVPRSGTTVFSRALARHCGIAMAPETHFISEIWRWHRDLNLANEGNAELAIDRFAAGRWFHALELEKSRILEQFCAANRYDWAGLFDAVLTAYMQTCGLKRRGEKTPGHYLYAEQLLDWYPDCRLIFVFRDPRAVVASSQRAPFAPPYAWFTAKRWNRAFEINRQIARDDRVALVRYEDFVQAPEQTINEVITELDIPKANLTTCDATSHASHSQSLWKREHLAKAEGNVNIDSLERWRQELAPSDIWQTQQITVRRMNKLGYERIRPDGMIVRHVLRYIFSYPFQRLSLAIESAWCRRTTSERSIKIFILILVARGVDHLDYLILRLHNRFTVGKELQLGNSTANFRISPDQELSSSFSRMNAPLEDMALFVNQCLRRHSEILFNVSNKRQHLAARKLGRTLNLAGKYRIKWDIV